MTDFEQILRGSAMEHGHLCPGQVIGVRMALLGLELIGIDNPGKNQEIKMIPPTLASLDRLSQYQKIEELIKSLA